MERVIVTAGTKTNLYNLFEDLQDYTSTNSTQVLGQLFSSRGISALTTSGGEIDASDTSFKVTGTNGQPQVTVAVGEALTSGLHYLAVTSPYAVSVAALADGNHTLFARHTYAYDTPVNVASGFAYALSGISSINSRAHDTISFLWDTNPLVSGIALATVTVTSSVLSGTITDLRKHSVLKINTAMLQDNVVRTDKDYTQVLVAGLTVPELKISGTGVLLTLESGITTVTLTLAQLQDLLTRVHTQHTDTGTTSSSFTVGVGGSNPRLVVLESDTPMPPKNVRIVDAYSPTYSRVRRKEADADLADEVRTGIISHEATISLEWNYKDIVGDGGKGAAGATDTGKFRITNSGGAKVWTSNELVDYHLYMPSVGLDYKITANTATSGTETVLTVTPYGHVTIIDGINASNPTAIIHSNCDSYEIVVTPVLESGALVPHERYEEKVTMQESPTIMQQTMNLFLGEKVIVKIRAKSGTEVSTYTEMPAGLYTKTAPFATVQNYTKPYYVALPLLDSTGAKVGANTTPAGFTMTIVGWDAATDFEVCYTTDASGPDYLNETHEKFTTRQRSADVVVTGSRTYNIAVRPLISGWVVAPAKTVSVVSGAGGNIPKDNAYSISNINFKSYTGSGIGSYSIPLESWATGAVYSPAGTLKPAALDSNLIGSYVTFSGTDYIIADLQSSNYVTITDLSGNVITSSLTGAYEINTSKASRVLARATNWPVDAQITSVVVEQWSKGGNNNSEPVVRWYQESMEAYADSIPLIEKGATNYSQTTDVTILAQNGNRTLVVDLWDPSEGDNTAGFMGNIIVYWKPYISTGRKTDNTSTPPISLAEES